MPLAAEGRATTATHMFNHLARPFLHTAGGSASFSQANTTQLAEHKALVTEVQQQVQELRQQVGAVVSRWGCRASGGRGLCLKGLRRCMRTAQGTERLAAQPAHAHLTPCPPASHVGQQRAAHPPSTHTNHITTVSNCVHKGLHACTLQVEQLQAQQAAQALQPPLLPPSTPSQVGEAFHTPSASLAGTPVTGGCCVCCCRRVRTTVGAILVDAAGAQPHPCPCVAAGAASIACYACHGAHAHPQPRLRAARAMVPMPTLAGARWV